MSSRTIILLTIFIHLGTALFSQEFLTGLSENPVIVEEVARLETLAAERESLARDEVTPLFLPFFDDFTQSWIFPADGRWANSYAYINTNFAYHSVNRGVATLDAIDNRGRLHQNASTFPFGADTLTSQPIRLDSIISPVQRPLTPADSIYLSFFYQPEGRGNPPEPFDSLILNFGYYTGRDIFAGYFDSLLVPLSWYLQPGDTLFPGDTIYSPGGECDPGLFAISSQLYTYQDAILLPCDSVFIPEYKWQRVWSTPGMALQEFYETYGTYSRQVLIPITDTLYFGPEFRFRFHNFASLATENTPSWRSNCDQWNLDYIYLDRNRSYDDTTYRDVSFVERPPSLLRNYEAMPYKQYVNDPTNEMKDDLELLITNLDSTIYNTSFYYSVYELNGPFQYTFPGGNCNLGPVYEFGYQDCISCAAHACPPVNFLFPLSNADSAEFEIRYFIIGDITPVDTVADTLRYRQKFFNYFAYDDGTPEAGYGLTPAGAKLGYQFRLNTRDTLRAIEIFFNRTQGNANEVFFDLVVWRDNNGKPGEELYRQPMQKVEFSETLNEFHTYFLDEPLEVNGTIYIGCEQLTLENLNIGYDRYNDAQQHIFYNTDGTWYPSTYQGALLMRPVIGKKFSWAGTPDEAPLADLFRVYPNPVNGADFFIRYEGARPLDMEEYEVRIISMLGAVLYQGPYRESFRSALPAPGVYLIQITGRDGIPVFTTRVIKS